MKYPLHPQIIVAPVASESVISAPIVARPAIPAPTLPEFIRLPRIGDRCPWSGLSRAVMWRLIEEKKIRSVSLRKPGALKGTRLIVLASLLDYLRSLATDGNENTEA